MTSLGLTNPHICTNLVPGYSSVVSSSTPINLNFGSNQELYLTGSTAQNIVLPPSNTLTNGQQFKLSNTSSATASTYAPGVINGRTVANYTFPLTTITVNTINGTFPGGGGTIFLLTTTGLQTIVYTSFAAGVFTFASTGTGTALSGSIVSTVMTLFDTAFTINERVFNCTDNTGVLNTNGWYSSQFNDTVLDSSASNARYPRNTLTEGVWYGTNTKAFTSALSVNFGPNAKSQGTSTVSIGNTSTSNGISSISLGTNSVSNGNNSISIGVSATTGSSSAAHISIGNAASCNGGNFTTEAAISIGNSASCVMNPTTFQGPIAIGRNAVCNFGDVALGQSATSTLGIAIGAGAVSSVPDGRGIAIGGSSLATGPFGGYIGCTAVGYLAQANGSRQTAFGHNARAISNFAGVTVIGAEAVSTGSADVVTIVGYNSSSTSATGACLFGANSVNNGVNAVLIGQGSSCSVATAVGIGASTIVSGTSAVVIGASSTVSGASAVVLGASSSASGASAVAIGASTTATAPSVVAILGNTGTSAALRSLSILGAGNTTKTGTDNLLIGGNVGSTLSSGANNTLFGFNAGRYIGTGSDNMGIGVSALQQAGKNSQSTAIGNLALSRMSETAYTTGTAAQSALAVTGTSTSWNGSMVAGSYIVYQSGNASMPVRITSTNSATSITAEANVTIATVGYSLVYGASTYAVNTASQSGTTVTGTSTTFTNDMVGGTLTYFGQIYSNGAASQSGTVITGSGFTSGMVPGYIVYFTSFTINPLVFASQSGFVVTATAASFSPSDVGTYIIFTGGNEVAYITSYINNTTVNVATSRTIGSTNFIMTGPQTSASLVTGFSNATTLTTPAVSSQTVAANPFILFYNNGAAPTRITQFNSATSLTVETSQTIASTNYIITYSNFTDRVNTVFGYAAGENIRDGTRNTLIGASVGGDIYNGIDNVIVGTLNTNPVVDSNNITFGTGNVNAGGVAIGRSNTVAALSNIAIGASSQANSTNTIAIGSGAIASVANSIVLGQSATVVGASSALGLALNTASVQPGTLGLTVNNASYQMPMYTSYYQSIALIGTGTTVLNYTGANSAKMTYFTGNFTQNVVLPPANTGGALGYELKIVNVSSGDLSIYADGGLTELVTTLVAPVISVSRGGWAYFTLIDTSANVAASWSAELGTTNL